MNNVILKGNLTRDPEVREIETNGRKTKVANFTLAVSRFFKKANGERDKDTVFISCEAWDTGAESIEKLLHKGDPVLLNGSLKNETWEKDGVRQWRTKVRVSIFDKLYRAPKRDVEVTPGETSTSTDAPTSEDAEKPAEPAGKPNPGGEDIPF